MIAPHLELLLPSALFSTCVTCVAIASHLSQAALAPSALHLDPESQADP